MTPNLYRINIRVFAMAAPASASDIEVPDSSLSDVVIVSFSSEDQQSSPTSLTEQLQTVVSVSSSPMSDGSGFSLLVRRVSGSDQPLSSDPFLHDQQDSEVVVGGSETVIAVSAKKAHFVIGADCSGSMLSVFPKVMEQIENQVEKAHKEDISVDVIFFCGCEVRVEHFPPGRTFNPLDYTCDGSTPLYDAMIVALKIAQELSDVARCGIFFHSDGEDNTSISSKYEARKLYQKVKETCSGTAFFIISSDPHAIALTEFFGVERERVIALTGEENRSIALEATGRVMRDFHVSSDACFSREEQFSSEGPSHHWQYPPCVPTPKGPNVSHSNGSGGGASDYQSSEY
jgi:hypothetical protein